MIPVSHVIKKAAADDTQQIISKVEYYDTPFGVPSKGLSILYQKTDYSGQPIGNIGLAGNDRMISYNFGQGAAFSTSDESDPTNYFKITWEGYFYSESAGDYSFVINKDEDAKGILTLNGTEYTATGADIVNGPYVETLSADSWIPFKYEYYERKKNAYTSVLWKPPTDTDNATFSDLLEITNGADNQHYRPISAGVTNVTTGWEDPTIMQGVIDIDGSYGSNKLREYSITVPLSPKPTTETFYNDNTDVVYYYDDKEGSYMMRTIEYVDGVPYPDDPIMIRPGRLVRIYAGYQTGCTWSSNKQGIFGTDGIPFCTNTNTAVTGYFNQNLCPYYGNGMCPANTVSGDDYIQRFDGIVTSLEANRSRESSTLTIVCTDHMVLAQEHIDQNYPDVMSYLNTGLTVTGYRKIGVKFIDEVFNLKNKPIAYDSWPVGFAIRDIMMKSGIDPTKMFSKKSLYDSTSSLVTGSSYISKALDEINLPRNANFVRNRIANDDSIEPVADDEYLWSTSFGDSQDSILKKIVDNYGYYLQCTHNGQIEVRQINAEEYAEQDGLEKDGAALGGNYDEATSDPLTVDVSGSSIRIKTIIDTETGPVITGFRITKDAGNSNKVVKWGSNYPSNILYGVFYGPATGTSAWQTLAYTKTQFGTTPPTGLEVGSVLFTIESDTTRGPYPISGGARTDYCPNIECDVYFGPATYSSGSLSSNVGNSSYLVKSSYRMSDYGPVDFSEYNRKEEILFDQNITTTGGLYVLEFVATGSGEEVPSGIGSGRFVSVKSFKFAAGDETHPFYSITVDGLNRYASTGYKDTDYAGSGNRVYNDIELRGAYTQISPGNTTRPATTFSVYNSSGHKVAEKSLVQSYTSKRTYLDGPDAYGDFDNIVEFRPWDLGLAQSGGSFNTYDNYKVKIESNYSLGTAKVEEVAATTLEDEIAWTFNTQENISAQSFTISTNYENVRNDILVVGSNNGALIDTTTETPANQNNPIYHYTFSRAVDLDSVYNIGSPKNIGRYKEFLIFEPGIKSTIHADWLAKQVLLTYNKNRNGASFQTTAVPFIDSLDKVYVHDNVTSLFSNEDVIQYIDSVTEKISRDEYTMNIQTTPYKPWPSFSRLSSPTVNSGDDAIKNVEVFDSNGDPLQETYLVDGVTGTTYDPYDNERDNGRTVSIKFKVVDESFVTCRVKSSASDRPIIYLVGNHREGRPDTAFDGELIPAQTTVVVEWDGMDAFGNSRINISTDDAETFAVNTDSKFFYSYDGEYYLEWIIEDPYDTSRVFTVDSRELSQDSISDDAKSTYLVTDGKAKMFINIELGEMLDGKILVDTSGSQRNETVDIGYLTTNRLFGFRVADMPNGEMVPNLAKILFEDEIAFNIRFDRDMGPDIERKVTYDLFIDHTINTGLLVRAPDYIENFKYGDTYTFEDGSANGGPYSVPYWDIIVGPGGTQDSPGNYAYRDLIDVGIARYFSRYTTKLSDPPYYSGSEEYEAAKLTRDELSAFKVNYADFKEFIFDEYLKDKKADGNFDEAFNMMDIVGIQGCQAQYEYRPKYEVDDGAHRDLTLQGGTQVLIDENIYFGIPTDGLSFSIDMRNILTTEKFFFSKTPNATYISDEPVINSKQIKLDPNLPEDEYDITYVYRPEGSEWGIEYFHIPPIENAKIEEYKQMVREAFNIAKWHVGLKRWGMPTILHEGVNVYWPIVETFSDGWTATKNTKNIALNTAFRNGREVDNMPLWREFLGNTDLGTITSAGRTVKYWREDPEVAQYVKIAFSHIVQCRVKPFDNSGRGMAGVTQPSKEFRVNPPGVGDPIDEDDPNDRSYLGNWSSVWYQMTPNSNAVSDNFVKMSQDTDEYMPIAIIGHGYEKIDFLKTGKSFIAHAHWYRPNGYNDYNTVGDFNSRPSKLHIDDETTTWADPIWFKTTDGADTYLIAIHEGWGMAGSYVDNNYRVTIDSNNTNKTPINAQKTMVKSLNKNILGFETNPGIELNGEALSKHFRLPEFDGPRWFFRSFSNSMTFNKIGETGTWAEPGRLAWRKETES